MSQKFLSPETIVADANFKIEIKFDCEYGKFFGRIFNASGDVVGETIHANNPKHAEKLAYGFLFNADHDLTLSAVY